MHFLVVVVFLKKILLSSGQHIIVLFVPFEINMNKAIYFSSLNSIHGFYSYTIFLDGMQCCLHTFNTNCSSIKQMQMNDQYICAMKLHWSLCKTSFVELLLVMGCSAYMLTCLYIVSTNGLMIRLRSC